MCARALEHAVEVHGGDAAEIARLDGAVELVEATPGGFARGRRRGSARRAGVDVAEVVAAAEPAEHRDPLAQRLAVRVAVRVAVRELIERRARAAGVNPP